MSLKAPLPNQTPAKTPKPKPLGISKVQSKKSTNTPTKSGPKVKTFPFPQKQLQISVKGTVFKPKFSLIAKTRVISDPYLKNAKGYIDCKITKSAQSNLKPNLGGSRTAMTIGDNPAPRQPETKKRLPKTR